MSFVKGDLQRIILIQGGSELIWASAYVLQGVKDSVYSDRNNVKIWERIIRREYENKTLKIGEK